MIAARDSPLRYHGVMVSSTFTDLERHRAALIKAIKGQGLTDVAMENDSAKADADVIDSSLQMVRNASAYVCLIGKKYGQMPACPIRNPGKLSVTELEFNEALRLGRPILLFIMGDDHPVREADIEINAAKRRKLIAFRDRAKQMKPGSTVHRVYATFETLEDFTSKAIQAVADLRRYIDDLDKLDGWGAPTSQAVAPTLGAHLQQRKALFIGREPEIETLRRQLQEPGALAYISGVAGRGKTALALEYAHRYKGDFESVHWIPCQERTLVQMAGELAWQLGLKPEGELDMIVRELNGHCARKRCLLVLDNVDDEAPSRLIPGGCTSVLVTTRLTNLPFLRHHQPLQLPLFTEEQCFELFRREIGKEEVDRHQAEARSLFRRLGHLPIGISVAASLVREDVRYTIEGMAKNLPANAYALLRDAVAALTPAAQTLLAAMAVCASEGFRLSLAAEVVEMDEASALDALQEICSRSLAEELDRSARRYRLHALVREAAGRTDLLQSKHAKVLGKLFGRWETRWRDCEEDMADWRAAFMWALEQSGQGQNWPIAKSLAYAGYRLAHRLGRLLESEEICEKMLREATRRGDLWALQAWNGRRAEILQIWGRLEEAMTLHKKKEEICLELGHREGLFISYADQATILRAWGLLEEAIALLKKEEAICLELGNQDGLQACYGNQALILKAWGRLEEAMDLNKKQETICLDLGNLDGLRRSYGDQALILRDWGMLQEATELHKKEEAICLQLGNRDGLQNSYGGQASVLMAWGRLEEAMALLKKQETICLELGNKSGLAYCYYDWGLIARQRHDSKIERERLEGALALFVELKMPREIKAVQDELDKTNGAGQDA